MVPVRTISTLSGFAAKQFAVLTPFITVAMVAICAAQLSWMGWMVGIPPAEVAFEFVQEAALPALGGVGLLTIIALCFAVIAGFGGWCLSQPKKRFILSAVSSLAHRLLTSLVAPVNRLFSYATAVCPTALDDLLLVPPLRRLAAPNAASLSGASPLLL